MRAYVQSLTLIVERLQVHPKLTMQDVSKTRYGLVEFSIKTIPSRSWSKFL